MKRIDLILGGGVTGLAAGLASGLPVYEATDSPGGICSSYYLRPGGGERLRSAPADGEAYRFEIGGGHWIFGGEPFVLRFIQRLAPAVSYGRVSSVYLPDRRLRIPYPLQNHLHQLGAETAARAFAEMQRSAQAGAPVTTMAEWLRRSFGGTLCDLFFVPFHDLYTAGLWTSVAPQDAYKSPVDLALVERGLREGPPPVGYNATFIYPRAGLNALAQRMAGRCALHYGRRAVRIDPEERAVHFEDGSAVAYDTILSTLPLNRAMELTGLKTEAEPDPSTSVVVLNIGAVRGGRCPDDHWLYVPASEARFHRVGFYSNVDRSFLPASARVPGNRVSIYVERAHRRAGPPATDELEAFGRTVVRELQDWGWIETAEVVDPTWIDVAYTWSWPGSRWRQQAIAALEERAILPVGRYGRWVFQGIADSIRDGFIAGTALGAERSGA